VNPVVLLACIGGPLLLLWLISGIHKQERELGSLERRFERERRRRETLRWWDDYKAGKPRKFQ